jgi:hypothetical protein
MLRPAPLSRNLAEQNAEASGTTTPRSRHSTTCRRSHDDQSGCVDVLRRSRDRPCLLSPQHFRSWCRPSPEWPQHHSFRIRRFIRRFLHDARVPTGVARWRFCRCCFRELSDPLRRVTLSRGLRCRANVTRSIVNRSHPTHWGSRAAADPELLRSEVRSWREIQIVGLTTKGRRSVSS